MGYGDESILQLILGGTAVCRCDPGAESDGCIVCRKTLCVRRSRPQRLKPVLETGPLIAAVNRWATQNQNQTQDRAALASFARRTAEGAAVPT